MYYYLYDSFLQDKKYSRLLGDIEARLIDLSIQGRSTKLNILNDIKELISDAVKQGAETVVVLGDDRTISKAISAVMHLDVTLGIIPIGDNNFLADYLGIPQGLQACEVLSKRVKEEIDIAKVGANYFAFYLKALSSDIKIISDDSSYSITPMSSDLSVYVCNFRPDEIELADTAHKNFFIPHDGRLELVIKSAGKPSIFNKLFSKGSNVDQVGQYTILPFSRVRLEPSKPDVDVKLILDNDRIIKAPVEIEVLPKRVTLIVGKSRMF